MSEALLVLEKVEELEGLDMGPLLEDLMELDEFKKL